MIRRRLPAPTSVFLAAGAVGILVELGCSRKEHRAPPPVASVVEPSHSSPVGESPATLREPSSTSGPVRYLLVGGGATPESTEVSLEQDLALVQKALPSPGTVLFAGGADSLSVREIDPETRGDTLLVALGDLFHPRAGRRSRYRAPHLDAERANVENVERRLSSALDAEGPALLLYVAAHGDQGATPRDNYIALWGGRPLTVARLAELTERHSRPLRMIATSCYSGGFADLAFAHADPHEGPSRVPRCGLFAGTWDRQTSGCDANPDRRAQESYGIHFAHALGNTDRSGARLAPELVDFDRDGKVSLLEAHSRARIAAASLDVPTTTSERWLRSVTRSPAPIDPKLLPEDVAVTAQLGAALNLLTEGAANERWGALDRRLAELDDAMHDATDALDDRIAALQGRLLERWPMLDDAFHPAFAATLQRSRRDVVDVLEHSDEAAARTDAQAEVDRLDAEMSPLEVEEARVLRLKRAYETLHLAAALMRQGGAGARYYQTLLACERSAP